MKVKDLMTKKVITVDINESVEKVASILTYNRIHGVPVMEGNEIKGIITETDFFTRGRENLYLPSFISFVKKFEFNNKISKNNNELLNKIIKAKARDIMSPNCRVVFPETEISEVLRTIKKTGYHTFPVVDRYGTLVGIITLFDLISVMNDNINDKGNI